MNTVPPEVILGNAPEVAVAQSIFGTRSALRAALQPWQGNRMNPSQVTLHLWPIVISSSLITHSFIRFGTYLALSRNPIYLRRRDSYSWSHFPHAGTQSKQKGGKIQIRRRPARWGPQCGQGCDPGPKTSPLRGELRQAVTVSLQGLAKEAWPWGGLSLQTQTPTALV